MNRTIVGLLVICCAWGAAANAAQPATTTCDRECLRGKVTQLLYALLKHDVSGLPVAGTLRVTEDAVEKPLAPAARTSPRSRSRSSSASATCRPASSPWTSAWASSGCAWPGVCASAAAIS